MSMTTSENGYVMRNPIDYFIFKALKRSNIGGFR